MTSKCEEIKRSLTDYALLESPKDEAAAVESHLPRCVTCRQELDDIRAMLGLLQRAEEPQDLPRNIRVVAQVPPSPAKSIWPSLWNYAGRMSLAGSALACLAVGLLGLFQTRVSYRAGDFEIAFGAKPPAVESVQIAANAGNLSERISEATHNQLTKSEIEALVAAAIQSSEQRQKSGVMGLVRDASLKADERRNADVQQMAETFRYMQAAQTNLWKEQVQSQQIVATLAQKNGINLAE